MELQVQKKLFEQVSKHGAAGAEETL